MRALLSRIDFLITNDGHHTAMFRPVIRELSAHEELSCRLVSLCELRGVRSPAARYAEAGVPFVEVVPWRLRRSPAVGRKKSQQAAGRLRRWARTLAWKLLLESRLRRCFDDDSALAVLPNDGGFPYDRICRLLRRRRIPFAILQEGVRFRQPRETDQGQGGSDAVLVWGEASAAYYREQGTPADRIAVTGCPRFDALGDTDWGAAGKTLHGELGLGSRNLLLLSNPIDDLGFGSHESKLRLLRRFVAGLGPLLADPGFRLVVKLHRRESARDLEQAIADLPDRERVVIVEDAPLYPLLAVCDAAVAIATSAGLETLLLGKPLAVLEIPGFGFAHDYVSRGAALGLSWDEPLTEQIERLLSGSATAEAAVRDYVDSHLAALGNATRNVVDQLLRLLGRSTPSTAPLT